MLSNARTRRCAALVAGALLPLLTTAPAHAFTSEWTPLGGLNAVSGGDWIRDYETAATPGTVLAATEGGGIFRSVDAGVSWRAVNQGLTDQSAKIVRALALDGTRMLAGTQRGVYVLNGSTWTGIGQGEGPGKLNASVQALLPLGGTLLAGTFAGGIYRSSDNGQTWQPPGPGSGMPAGETVWSLTSFGSMVLAGTSSGVYRSLDGGVTWTPSGDGIPPGATTYRVFGDSGAPNVWYAGTGSGVYRSLDAGFTWAPITDGLPGGSNGAVRDLKTFVSPGGLRLYAATGRGVYAATVRLGLLPGEVSWSQVTTRGLDPNLVIWALSDWFNGTSLLAGTQSDGGFGLTFVPPVSLTDPQVSGTAKVGQTLTALPGAWGGTGELGFGFAWERCTSQDANCRAIRGATGSTYIATEDDFGTWLRVSVTASNGAPLFAWPSEVSASVRIAAAPGSLPGDTTTSAPSVTVDAPGDGVLPKVGDVVRITTKTTMPNQTFNPNPLFALQYQWLRCDENGASCLPIAGATNQTYTLQTADAGLRVKARVTGANQYGARTLESANASNLIIPDPAAALVAPALSGTAAVGETLVGNVGAWKSAKTTWERQWQRCESDGTGCTPIIGAAGAAYTVQPIDAGKRLRMRVLADVNESYKLPAAVEAFTPLSEVVTGPGVIPVPGGGGTGGGGGVGGGGAGGGGESAAPDRVKPALKRVSLSKARFKAGARGVALRFRLSEAATLRTSVVRGKEDDPQSAAEGPQGRRRQSRLQREEARARPLPARDRPGRRRRQPRQSGRRRLPRRALTEPVKPPRGFDLRVEGQHALPASDPVGRARAARPRGRLRDQRHRQSDRDLDAGAAARLRRDPRLPPYYATTGGRNARRRAAGSSPTTAGSTRSTT